MRLVQARPRRAVLMALSLLAAPAFALELPAAKVVLTIDGAVDKRNQGDMAAFDMAMLAALPQHSFTTMTPWYPQPRKFTGPLLRDVLAAAGAKGGKDATIEALAINDYKVTIPFSDVQRYPVLLARLMDDQPMPLRDKGPLFIVYPFDSDATLRSSLYYSRSAWQLKALRVR